MVKGFEKFAVEVVDVDVIACGGDGHPLIVWRDFYIDNGALLGSEDEQRDQCKWHGPL